MQDVVPDRRTINESFQGKLSMSLATLKFSQCRQPRAM